MNLGPFKDRTRKKGSFIKAVGKQGICAIAFLALAVGGIVLAVSLGGSRHRPTPRQSRRRQRLRAGRTTARM